MALDREETLKKAEKLLRQGRLDAAIAEYLRVVEDQPKDWNTANALGDLYMRAAQTPAAVAQFARIAEHFLREGFYPKAGALFKKILKISPDDESAQLQLADISAKQGLLADAKSYFAAVVARRRSRGDQRGADEIALRLADVDPPERLRGQRPFMAADPLTENLFAASDPVEEPAALDVEEEQPPPKDVAVALEDRPMSVPADPLAVEHPKPADSQRDPPSAVRRSLGPMEIDLSSVLAEFESFEPAPMIRTSPPREDLEEVFQDFRNEVTRQTGTDDAGQLMTLANTYLEMGMEDDAIQSLKTAARSTSHRFEAATLLARLFKGRQDMAQAVEWLERAAEAPAPSTDAGRALLYDLGATLEAMGETARALGVFMELQADADQYRDVDERVERLARAQTGG